MTKGHKIHKLTSSMCAVCDTEITPKECVELHKSRRQTHVLCIDCAHGYLMPKLEQITENLRKNIRVNAGIIKCSGTYHSIMRNKCKMDINISDVVCPTTPDCEFCLPLFRIKHVINNNNVYVCPNKECGDIIDVDMNVWSPNVCCLSCKTEWCRTCQTQPFHIGESCIEHEMKKNDTPESKALWALKTKGLLKFCPRCSVATMKSEGCNKMWCEHCKAKWCWLCREGKDKDIDYDHYNENSETPCANKLWQGVDMNTGFPIEDEIMLPPLIGEDGVEVFDDSDTEDELPPLIREDEGDDSDTDSEVGLPLFEH